MSHRLSFFLLGALLAAAPLPAQETESLPKREKEPWILSAYLSTWINRCDVPSAAQFSSYTPAVGPSLALSKGRWRMAVAAYFGDYEFTASEFQILEGSTNSTYASLAPENTQIQFESQSARERGFTLYGTTSRQDLSFSVNYRASNALQVGLSAEYNHRDAQYTTILPFVTRREDLTLEAVNLYTSTPLEGDQQGRSLVVASGQYNIHQLWLGPQLHGFTPLGSRFGGFYNLSFLVLAYESERAPIYLDEQGKFIPPGQNSELLADARKFGENFGTGFSLGLSYSILPQLAVWGGYSVKFFAEENTDLLDHSLYQGPYFGVGYIFF